MDSANPTSSNSTVIRPATDDDLLTVETIFSYYVTTSVITFAQTPPSIEDWRQLRTDLADRGLPFLVAIAAGEIAGYAYVSPWRTKPAYRHTVEDSIYLAPERTGRGLGRRLLDALLTQCVAAGVQQVIAVVADNGDPTSIALHRACGFTDVGQLRGVGSKHGRIVDTVLLQRDLTAESPEVGDSP